MTNPIVRFEDDEGAAREWLETNGLGGFAASTIIGLNTRRYHGLLTAATDPPAGRILLLSKMEDTLVHSGGRYELSVNQYPGVIHPQGHRYLKEFRLDPFPVFTYDLDGVLLEKRVFMVHGENTTVVEYALRTDADCTLEVRPLLGFRDYHSTTHRNDALNPQVITTPGMTRVQPYAGLPTLHISHNGADVAVTGNWYENFEYLEEQARGLEYREDLFNPFLATFPMNRNRPAHLIASTEVRAAALVPQLREGEIRRRRAIIAAAPSEHPLVQALTAAADQFVVNRGESKTVIAGYPWFTDWGRDTMIALPGLTLVTGRFDIARSILLTFASSLDRGMLPNRFPDAGQTPEYNTVDATLWFFEAIRALLQYTGDYAFVREHLYERLKEILHWHLQGTRYGIRVDDDGLLQAGESGVQLTWMDAKAGDQVITPRHGKPVEIQALWYNALRITEDLARRFSDSQMETFWGKLAGDARKHFDRKFWNVQNQCLFDVVGTDFVDASIRPNQIFAVSLTHALVEKDRAASIVRTVERELLTPMGLRSLSPADPKYKPRYEGGVWDRDSSYHQGTVWPWLMGPFLTAYVRVNDRSDIARERAAHWLAGFEEHLNMAGLGQISEIADAEAPHHPRGCFAQAWSVAELLRAAVEDVSDQSVRSC